MSTQFTLPFDPTLLSSMSTAQLATLVKDSIPVASWGWVWVDSVAPPTGLTGAFDERTLWLDTNLNRLLRYDVGSGTFQPVELDINVTDHTLAVVKLDNTTANYLDVVANDGSDAVWKAITDVIQDNALSITKLDGVTADRILGTDPGGVKTWLTGTQAAAIVQSALDLEPGDRSIIADYIGWNAMLFGTTTGTGTEYVLSLSPTTPAIDFGDGSTTSLVFWCKFHTKSTGAAALTINGTRRLIKKNGSSAIEYDDISADSIHLLAYDGTNLQILTPLAPSFKKWVTYDIVVATIVADANALVTHTLGKKPELVQAFYRFKAAPAGTGYVIGDELPVDQAPVVAIGGAVDVMFPSVVTYIPKTDDDKKIGYRFAEYLHAAPSLTYRTQTRDAVGGSSARVTIDPETNCSLVIRVGAWV